MKRYFHAELNNLKNKLIALGERTHEVGRIAIDGLLEADMDKVEQALKLDDAIDKLEDDIAHDSVRYVTLRAPVSSDMRLVFVAIKASHDFERAADEAHGIAKKARAILNRDGRAANTGTLAEMSDIALEMMRDAITCLVEEDIEKAKAIITRDKAVDRLNKENFEYFSSEGRNDDTSTATRVEMIMVSKAIERIGDHAKNLAEEVEYLLSGK